MDNIMFENPAVADRFLNSWRQSGCQRIGILFGHYEMFKEVPLGIRAKVAAIYEPPQVSAGGLSFTETKGPAWWNCSQF